KKTRKRTALMKPRTPEGETYGCVLDAAQVVALPVRNHLDRIALLFQPGPDAILRRDRSAGAKRCDSKTGAPGTVVVSMGRDGNRYLRPAVFLRLVVHHRHELHWLDGVHHNGRHTG